MKLLVTGGTGFIGGALLPRLVEAGHEVLALARGEAPAQAGVRWLEADLAAPSFASQLPDEPCDGVVHLAQSLAYRDFPDGASDMFAVNCAATQVLLDWARNHGASRFLLASTGSIYGRGSAPFTEDDPTPARDYYSCSKKAAEQLAQGYADLLTVQVVRIFGVYGPGQAGKLVPNLAARIGGGGAVDLAGEDGLVLSPLYIDDLVAGLLAILALDAGHVLNLGATDGLSLRAIATAIGAAIGEPVQFNVTEGETPGLVGDVSRLQALTSWAPGVDLAEGMRRTFAANS